MYLLPKTYLPQKNSTLIAVVITTLVLACNTSKGILPLAEVESITMDLAHAEEFVTLYVLKDTSKKHKPETMAQYQKIFALHKTNSKQFYNSFQHYINNPTVARGIMDSLSARVRRVQYLSTIPTTPLKPTSVN